MIYGGDLMSNFSGGVRSGDDSMTEDVILSEISKILYKNPSILVETLNQSGISTKNSISKTELINSVVEALYSSNDFRNSISYVIVNGNKDKYSNADGEFFNKLKGALGGLGGGGDSSGGATSGGASSGGGLQVQSGGGGVVGSVASAIGSIFGTVKSFKDAKNQKEDAKSKLQMSILNADNDKKKSLLPVVLIGGILLIGGIVAYISLKEK